MKRFQTWVRTILLASSSGGVLLGGCCVGDVCGIGGFLANFNPCGTILNCDPVTYRFIRSGYEGPGVNPAIDPACTYPPFCAGDPFVSTQNAGG